MLQTLITIPSFAVEDEYPVYYYRLDSHSPLVRIHFAFRTLTTIESGRGGVNGNKAKLKPGLLRGVSTKCIHIRRSWTKTPWKFCFFLPQENRQDCQEKLPK